MTDAGDVDIYTLHAILERRDEVDDRALRTLGITFVPCTMSNNVSAGANADRRFVLPRAGTSMPTITLAPPSSTTSPRAASSLVSD